MKSDLIKNSAAWRGAYPQKHAARVNVQKALQDGAWLKGWARVSPAPTPLWQLDGWAKELGLAAVALKDESQRSEILSFKALGAPLAMIRLILRLYPQAGFAPEQILVGAYAKELQDFTVITATDGNHGRALAAAAQSAGVACKIVLHEHVSMERERAISAYGAEIIRIKGNYDDSVAAAARLAKQHSWHVISDTSYPGYSDIPTDVMQGYGIIAEEILDQSEQPFTHVFLQAGVGALPAGIMAHLWERLGDERPLCVIVEPRQADCIYQSVLKGHAAQATGSVHSAMAGLACGNASPLAWSFLADCADFVLLVDDEQANDCVRLLATGAHDNVPIVAGESGVAGLAGLIKAATDAELRAALGLDAGSRVLLISSEGATAASGYASLTGSSAAAVSAQQQQWLHEHPAAAPQPAEA